MSDNKKYRKWFYFSLGGIQVFIAIGTLPAFTIKNLTMEYRPVKKKFLSIARYGIFKFTQTGHKKTRIQRVGNVTQISNFQVPVL
ncbi:MAG TPA: hypothetical protein PLC90_11595 [Bacteroidales bacterium]|nr:hypothetical protein [Bacteroidales bacterium]